LLIFENNPELKENGDLAGDIIIEEAVDLAGEAREVSRDLTGDIIIEEAVDLAGEAGEGEPNNATQ
jgi:hypothetical protein